MADAILQILLDNLTSLIQREIGIIMGVNDEMKKLSSTLTTIQAVLQDAENKQLHDKSIRNWLRKLNDLSYEIDDILDECATQVSKLEYQTTKSRVFNLNQILKKILYQHKIGRKMKQVTRKVDDVAAERNKFHLRETNVVLQNKVYTTRETGSVLNEPQYVCGRDDEKEKIVDMLVNKVKERRELSVLPIIGLGGLGKTTLAQLVFNDKRVTEHFEMKLWVCVSDDFDLKTMIKAMIESLTKSGKASSLDRLDSLQQNVSELLNQRRYLLVLDDVWNDDQEKWSMLKDLLACGSTGSSVIVTTRQRKVAEIMSTVPSHDLARLSEESCWLLFKQRAFSQEEGEHTELEVIGKQIVKKCVGVPLAAKTLGSLLRFERKEEDWVRVNESEMWNLPQEETSILPALRLSYNHLPFECRHCFAYCAVFLKDWWIVKEELIFHWIANGYISSDGTLEVEDVGNKIFNELVLRSLFENVTTNLDGSTLFQIHDLVHDLAQSIRENRVPGLPAEGDNRQVSKSKIRQVFLHSDFVAFCNPRHIFRDMDLSSVLEKFSRLRILDASDAGIKEVPSIIGNLKQVRYLNFSFNAIRTLPKALCSLWNLKILVLNYCEELVSLPKNLRYLHNLRHLFLEDCDSLIQMPPKMSELASLKTLSLFIVGEERCQQLGELQFLNLGGSLEIRHLERVKNPLDAKKANLAQKSHIRDLILNWETQNLPEYRESMDEKVLEALEPHANVEKLYIMGFQGKNFPLWMRNSTIENLVIIWIWECPKCSSLPQSLGELPRLKELFLRNLSVEYITEDEVPDTKQIFPVLQKLTLVRLPFLKGLSKKEAGELAFPNLQELYVDSCALLSLPQLSSLETLRYDSIVHTSLCKLENLTSLEVLFDENMNSIPKESLENLTCLKSLEIRNSQQQSLPEEGLQGLKSLKEFTISDSKKLMRLPEKWLSHLTTLEELNVFRCPELIDIPEEIKYLHNLTILRLNGLPKMVCLPNALQHLPLLCRLYLENLCELNSHPDCLPSLVSLHIHSCPKLVLFPAGIQQWTKLESLYISKCPELERRCQKGKGEDWHKIAHISDQHIG